ncbi:MAG TPA: helix-turn-helix domain-containing protein [Geminicoccus sp.]|uniref:helix-turn-helix transcriptional regulator n=1 Tax=Geminicoccus sp. TaxID=2024832 RepID=UPI002CC6E978|nr:helix-turn-helix domain-containing protein [Geminicoccus sp.]HWL69429.1 helix-turn-helix domain-containing protein [Geminicoccus sp.]
MTASLFEYSVRHFSQTDLAHRWGISPRTLERWRWLRQGPPYLKIGGRVAYRLQDVETFEGAQRRAPGAR